MLLLLQEIMQASPSPAIVMCVVGCMDAIAKNIGPVASCKLLVPFLVPAMVEDALNRRQIDTIAATINSILRSAVEVRRQELTQREIVEGQLAQVSGHVAVCVCAQADQEHVAHPPGA